MGRRVDIDDIVSAVEIADRIDLSDSRRVHGWRRRHPDFPEPLAVRGGVILWDWRDVARWLEATGRPTGIL